MLKRFSSNATANIFSGVVAAVYQLVITTMAIATWHGPDFATWALAMSIAAIAPILAANLSSVMTRRLVEVRHSGSSTDEVGIVLAGRRIGWVLASAGLIVLFVTGGWIHERFSPQVLSTSGFLILLAILLSTSGWVLLWQTRFGQYYADERNWLTAFTYACARVGGMLGMFSALALGGQNLIAIALGLCMGTWMALGAVQFVLPSPKLTGGTGGSLASLEIREQFQRTLRVLYGFAIGAASSLIIQYSIPLLFALIAPQRFNEFYLASTINAVGVGILAAVMSALLAPLTHWHATNPAQSVRRIAIFSPAICAGACLSVLGVCWFALDFMRDPLTARSADINDIRHFLGLLGLQAIVRTSAAGFATYISSAGTSRQMSTPLLIEMALVFTIAVPIGWLFGVNALLLGLTLSSLIGSQFSCQILTSLCPPARISTKVAFTSLLIAQLVGSAIWWWIVGAGMKSEWP